MFPSTNICNNIKWKRKFQPTEIILFNVFFILPILIAIFGLRGPYGSNPPYMLSFIVVFIGNFYLLISIDHYFYLHGWTISRNLDENLNIENIISDYIKEYSVISKIHKDHSKVKLAKYWYGDKYEKVISFNNSFDVFIRKTRIILIQGNDRLLVDISPYNLETMNEIDRFINFIENNVTC